MPRTNHIVLLDQLITIFGVAANPTLNSQLDRNQNIIELEENCILLRNMFDIEEQCELYSAIIKISALTLKGKIKANKNWTRLMFDYILCERATNGQKEWQWHHVRDAFWRYIVI
eukprot:154636_1